MTYVIEYEQEEDGRWLAEVLTLPGVLAYGATAEEACSVAESLALRVLSGQIGLADEQSPKFVTLPYAAWRTTRAQFVLAALLRTGWSIKDTPESRRILYRPNFPDLEFPFDSGDELGPRMLARMEEQTGLRPRRPMEIEELLRARDHRSR